MNSLIDKFDTYHIFSLETVEFLKNPVDFYSKLLLKFEMAHEVRCKTLSFGTKDRSIKLLEIMKLRKKNDMYTEIILDENRANRNKDLKTLLIQYNIKDFFRYYKTKTLLCMPKRIHELVSVLHSKIYLFDQTVLLSGANLDDSYFCNRMDRYMLFKDAQFSEHLKKKHFSAENEELKSEIKPFKDLKSKTYIFEFEHTDELFVLEKLMSHKYNEIILSTAYLNFTGKHFDIFKNINMKIVTCSKKSNTFNLDTYLEKFVNDEYTLTAIDVVKKLKNAEFYEYEKQNFTFHCKGLWAFGDGFAMTVVGSTNFNVRSICRDIESNFCLITRDPEIINDLRSEINNIMKDSKIMTLETLNSRKIGFLSKIGKPASKRFL